MRNRATAGTALAGTALAGTALASTASARTALARSALAGAVLAGVGALGLVPAQAQALATVPVQLTTVVGQVPVPWTPNVSAGPIVGKPYCDAKLFGSGQPCQSEVYATAYVNGDVVVVGAFTRACGPGKLSQGLCVPSSQVTRDDIVAYQASTGLIDPHFVPRLNQGPAWTVIPGPAGSNTVYVGGAFTTVNGITRKGIVQLHVNPAVTSGPAADGSVVTGFKANVSNFVRALALSPDGTALYAGGQFRSVNGIAESGLVRVSAVTGAVDPSFHVGLSDPIAGLPVKVQAMDLTANGRLLAFSGTALRVNGQGRPRLAIVATGRTLGAPASLADFTAPILADNCTTEHDYVRGLSFAPDGSFLVIADTGYRNDGSMRYSACDAVARFDIGPAASAANGKPADVAPAWLNYAGGDSFYSVAVAGGVVYVGGHNRWVNNYCGNNDVCEPNALLQDGLSALDASTGLGLAWWHPETLRGAGTMYLGIFGPGTDDGGTAGLAVGTDVDLIAGAYHSENALFPLAQATTKTPVGPIPSGVFVPEGGGSTSTPMCVADPADSSAIGTRIVLATCLNNPGQNWTVPIAGTTGQVEINGLCLGTSGGGTGSGTGVDLSACASGTGTQQWSQGPGNTVVNKGAAAAAGTGMCLDDPSGTAVAGTRLVIARCTGRPAQRWPLPAAPGPPPGPPTGPVYPQEVQQDKQVPCLDDAGNSTAAGTVVQLWTCRGDAQQDWAIEPGGTIQIHGGHCLDTAGGRTKPGTQVVLDPCDGSRTQLWSHRSNDSLVQRASGLCLDDPGAKTANGTSIRIWHCNGGTNQAWRLPAA